MTVSDMKIALVGAGNVASHIARALGQRLAAVVSRNAGHASAIAPDGVPAGSYDLLERVRPDMIIISVADHAVDLVVDAIGRLDYDPIVVHTSGTVPKEALAPVSPRTGVLYPLQTFSAAAHVDLSAVPFFTEAALDDDLAVIDDVARLMSEHVYHADAARRRVLHVAGVFTSNFTNVLMESVQHILGDAGYDLGVVDPLLHATVDKLFAIGPHDAQTGPARRGDFAVIERQYNSLPEDLRPVYRTLTDLILKYQGISNEQN